MPLNNPSPEQSAAVARGAMKAALNIAAKAPLETLEAASQTNNLINIAQNTNPNPVAEGAAKAALATASELSTPQIQKANFIISLLETAKKILGNNHSTN